ncbi:MAG TPA: GAF domain-containing sensor histidine kinase [Mycobacteriales bacterium]|nr:sensor signal transduction histidine kinase [Cryptosporangiaceae bacterium]MDQ1676215.1 two-component system, NarL family, sensor kinase [Actinomycetota bacterium]HEV7756266.1 GAF domain-containing sensor histidine kinase [Mycobacteriales bacterium]
MSEALADLERENALLLAIIQATSEGPGVEPLAAAVARLITAATATDVCFVHVLDDAGTSLTLAGATPPLDGAAGKVRLSLGTGVTGWVASHQRPAIIVDNKEADPRYQPIPALRGSEFTSMASVPMSSDVAGLVGVLNVHTRHRREFTDRDIRLLTMIGRLVAGAVHLARLHRQLAGRERSHERFVQQVVAAQEAERRRLAGDIHDGISQRLVSLSYHLDAADRTVRDDPAYAAEEIVLARSLADVTMDEARAAIGGLRPPVLDDLGLAGGLASLARSVPDLHAVLDLADERLPEHVEVALYRIAQEALQNVQKHAGAASTRLIFEVQANTARVEVRDDGVGFTPEPGHGGYGLNSMAERAELIGGRLTIRSRRGSGTSVIAVVPIPSVDAGYAPPVRRATPAS